MSTRALTVSEEQVRHFRALRTHLAGEGAASATQAARAMLGAQAQQENPGLHALSLRTASRPTARTMRELLYGSASRVLVRTWGQRDTLHIDAPEDWAEVVTARAEWAPGRRRGAIPTPADLEVAREAFRRANGPLLRADLFEVVPQRFVDEVADHPGAGTSAVRFAASRLIWSLSHLGEVCLDTRIGSENQYVARHRAFPELDWPEAPDPVASATALASRYLAACGPATAADIGHFFGARVVSVKAWLGLLEADGELAPITCGSRKGLWALRADLDALSRPAPEPEAWAPRLLPLWDTLMMTHKDKSWVIPEAEQPAVWRKAAMVSATVLDRGRIVATWSHRVAAAGVSVEVSPLSRWHDGLIDGVHAEAAHFAAHIEVPLADVRVVAAST